MKVKCDWCGKEFKKISSRVRSGYGNFCSFTCRVFAKKRKPATCHPDRLAVAHGLCRTCWGTKWERDNPGKRAGFYLKSKYGITPEQKNEILLRQEGVCAICKTNKATHIDHDHKTGRVRGILCHQCNISLGLIKENTSTMAAMIYYVDLWGKQ